MWRRLTVLLRGWANWLRDQTRNPAGTLEDSLQEMKDRLPLMAEKIDAISATAARLEAELARLEAREAALQRAVADTLRDRGEAAAVEQALTLETVREAQRRLREQLDVVQGARDKAEGLRQRFLDELEQRTQQATLAARDVSHAHWQHDAAEVLQQYRNGTTRRHHEALMQRLDEAATLAEARLQVALESEAAEPLPADRRRVRAEQTVRDYQQQQNGDR